MGLILPGKAYRLNIYLCIYFYGVTTELGSYRSLEGRLFVKIDRLLTCIQIGHTFPRVCSRTGHRTESKIGKDYNLLSRYRQ